MQTHYTNEPNQSATLTNAQVKFILNDHAIEYKLVNSGLLMLDEYNKNNVWFSNWIKPHKTYRELMTWLGY